MKLYFVMIDGRFINKNSNLQNLKLVLSHWMIDSVYYENIKAAKMLNTRLRKNGEKSYIVQARIELENTIGEKL